MDWSLVRLAHLDNEIIWDMADNFRIENWGDKIPFDVELIAEKKGILLTPIPYMKMLSKTDACITYNCEEIYYDDQSPEVRLRFSIAHELGHSVMHTKELLKMRPDSFEKWASLIEEMPPAFHKRFEYQANEFAGRLLVPLNKLFSEIVQIKDQIEIMQTIVGRKYFMTYPFIATLIACKFNVSDEVIKIRLSKEDINPFELIN